MPNDQLIGECVEAKGKMNKFRRQWEMIRQEHTTFLDGPVGTGTALKRAIHGDVPGTMTCLRKAIGHKNFGELWQKHKMALRDPKCEGKNQN